MPVWGPGCAGATSSPQEQGWHWCSPAEAYYAYPNITLTPYHLLLYVGLVHMWQQVYLLTPMDRATVSHAKSPIAHCTPSEITWQQALQSAVNGDEKCKKFAWFGGLGVTQGHQQHNHLIENIYDFLFDFNRNYVSILYRFRVIASCLSKVANLPWSLASENSGLYCIILCLAVLIPVQYRSVTGTYRHMTMAYTTLA